MDSWVRGCAEATEPPPQRVMADASSELTADLQEVFTDGQRGLAVGETVTLLTPSLHPH